MPAQWTADVLGQMHLNGITQRQLADHMGYTFEYVSKVLKGRREPQGAERKFRAAVAELIAER